jgi:phosphoribosylformylglycinamidine synthase II
LISHLYVHRTHDDPEALALQSRFQGEGASGLSLLRIERVFRLEGVSPDQAMKLAPLFCHPAAEAVTSQSVFIENDGPVVEVGYQRAVTDPECPSILRGAEALGVPGLEWARIAHRYQFCGLGRETALELASRHLFNPQVQVLIRPGETWDSLKPHGETGPVEPVPLKGLDAEALAALSEKRRLFLDAGQMLALQKIAGRMGRDLTDAELEMFAQTWSDHCFHTTWKSLGLLSMLMEATRKIAHPLVLSSFEDNAGVMDFYESWAVTVKGETHNSPTAVSPYGGIMTKHGGVIRDTLGCGQGAWPIGGSTVMGLGDPRAGWSAVPRGALHPKTLLLQAVRGTADYVNPMGIPMMFPVYRFHPAYAGKCFALGHSIGLIPRGRSAKGSPKPGDLAVLIGGRTGRDGLHGATVSSSSMTDKTAVVDAAHVQIGHPIEERKFMEAIPVLRDSDCLRAVTDLGAAGLSSAAGEMGSGTGVWINLALVPLKTEGMRPWEIWISESQERMLLAVPPEKWDEAARILERFEVPASVVGRFTESGRCQVVYRPGVLPGPDPPDMRGMVVDLDFPELRKGCPIPKTRTKKPRHAARPESPPLLKTADDWRRAFHAMLSHLNLCDQSPAGAQFDSTVQGITVAGPYGGKNGLMPNDVWISSPLRGKPYGVAASVAFNPLYGDLDPAGMVKLMVLESVSKLVAAGVDLKDIVLCDNFYTPRVNPETAHELLDMVRAAARLSIELGTPFISGKDSSSGTFTGENGFRMDVPETLCVLALGKMPDVARAVFKPFKSAGSRLLLVGQPAGTLGGSVFLDCHAQRGKALPDPDVKRTMASWKALKNLQNGGKILSASAVAEGGIFRRLFEMAMGSGLGCSIELDMLEKKTKGFETALFGESVGCILVEVAEGGADAAARTLDALPLGRVTETPDLSIRMGKWTVTAGMEGLIGEWKKPFREVAL